MGSSRVLCHIFVIISCVIILTMAMPTRDELDRLLSKLEEGQFGEDHIRNLDSLGGGNLVRDVKGRFRTNDDFAHKRFDSLSGITFGGQKRFYPENYDFFKAVPSIRRNFDEIDHSSFNGFNKRNFDEIDRSSFGNFGKREPSDSPRY